MDIANLRNQIDSVDDEIIKLFVRRMEISAQIAAYKRMHDIPIHVPTREREKLQDVALKAGSNMAVYACSLYDRIFELSRKYQIEQNTTAYAPDSHPEQHQ